jgi:hypothetical protein
LTALKFFNFFLENLNYRIVRPIMDKQTVTTSTTLGGICRSRIHHIRDGFAVETDNSKNELDSDRSQCRILIFRKQLPLAATTLESAYWAIQDKLVNRLAMQASASKS